MDDLANFLTDTINKCLADGMQMPLILATVAANGTVLVHRFHTLGQAPDILCEYPGDFRVPINMMIVDPAGNAARVMIDATGKATFH